MREKKTSIVRLVRTILAFALVGAVLASYADAHTIKSVAVDGQTLGALAGAAVAAIGKVLHLV